jgi:hypothetical protein
MQDSKEILKRLQLIKDCDPFNKRVLNDCYDIIQELETKIELLEKQLYELAGTEQKL